MICYSFGNLGELYQRFKKNKMFGNRLKLQREGDNFTKTDINLEQKYDDPKDATVTYIVSKKDKKTILAVLKTQDDWNEYKSREKKKEEHKQVKTTIEDRRKGKFVLLNLEHDAKKSDTVTERNEDLEKKAITVSPEDWLAQFYSTKTTDQKTQQKNVKSTENRNVSTQTAVQSTKKRNAEDTTTGTILANFEQLLLKTVSRPSSSLENRAGNIRRPDVDVSPATPYTKHSVDLIAASPHTKHVPANTNSGTGLVSHVNRRYATPAVSLTSQAKPQGRWRSSNSQRWRPVFSPSQREERVLRTKGASGIMETQNTKLHL